jgi:hypothetical protein
MMGLRYYFSRTIHALIALLALSVGFTMDVALVNEQNIPKEEFAPIKPHTILSGHKSNGVETDAHSTLLTVSLWLANEA